MDYVLITAIVAVVIVFSLVMMFLSRYRKCPSDKVLVIYGKVGKNSDGSTRSAKCIHGGAAFIWPIFQSYQYLDLTPISIQVDLTNALSRQNIRIDVPSRFTVGISTEQGIMQNAAERLLGLQLSEIQELSKDIIFGQLRLIIATMDIEEINTDRDKFLEQVSRNVEVELKKIGLRLINVNVTDITDESGYIAALGKEAAAKAINDARRSVAEQEREGAIGEANAKMEQRIKVSEADSVAIQGENRAKMDIEMSNAHLREKSAEAQRIATAAEKIQAAKALEESYAAEQEKFDGGFMLDLSIGKYIRLPKGRSLSLNLSMNNVTNNCNLRTGGYEQNRDDSYYKESGGEASKGENKAYKFSKNSKYYYANAFNFFFNVGFKF